MMLRSALFVLLLFVFGISSFAQGLNCSTKQYVPPTVRVEGITELLGDLVAVCVGGTPTAAGSPVPMVDITFNVPLPITNRLNASDAFIDALLLVDEPRSAANPNVPLLPCIDCAGALTGTGNGIGVYNGSPGRFNVFQGELTGSNTIRFRVPLDPPGVGGQRTLRITNVRINATSLAGQTPNTVIGTLSIPGANMNPGTQILGMAHRALRIATVENTSFFSTSTISLGACPQTKVFNPGTELPTPEFLLELMEDAPDGLRSRNVAQDLASGPAGAFANLPVTNGRQDIPSYRYGTETGFYADTLNTSRGLNRAGLATQGTRFYVRFSNATGMNFSMPVSLLFQQVAGDTGFTRTKQARGTRAILIQSDGNGNFTPVVGDQQGFAQLPLIGSTATAIYEVVASDANTRERLMVPVRVNIPGRFVPAGNVTVSVGLGPTSDTTGPDLNAAIPRFANGNGDSFPAILLTGQGCGFNDLAIEIYSASAIRGNDNAGSMTVRLTSASAASFAPTSTLRFTLPPGLTATNITFGPGWTCTLNTLSCTRTGTAIESNDSVLVLSYSVSPSASDTLTVSASITASGDEIPGNNSASFSFQVTQGGRQLVSTEPPSGLVTVVNGIHASWRRSAPAPAPGGGTVTVSTLPVQYDSDGVAYAFRSWSDGGALTHSTLNRNITASFDRIPVDNGMKCVIDTGVPPLVSATGKTEPLGDISLNCSGGTPTPTGSQVPKADLRVSIGSVLTSRAVFAGIAEALLIVDEPHSSQNPSTPMLPCGAPGSVDNGSGVCSVTGAGARTYDGSSGHANVFQGRFDAKDSIVFSQVPIDPPGPGNTRIFRIVNLRGDASLLGVSYALIPTTVDATVAVSPASTFSFAGSPSGVIGFIQESTTRTIRQTFSALRQCIGANPQIAADGSKPLDIGPGNGFQAMVRVSEGYPSAFTPKSLAVRFANLPGATSPSYPADTKQNIPGIFVYTMTMFYGGPGLEMQFPLLLSGGLPAPTAEFPAVRGLDVAGKAQAGSRIALRLSGIAPSVKVFVPARIGFASTLTNTTTGSAALTDTDATGSGAFSAIGGNAGGLAPLRVTPNGEALAVYEVLSADSFTQERLDIPVAFAFAAGQVPLGTIRATAGLAPIVTVPGDATDLSQFVPRYAPPFDGGGTLAAVDPCAYPDRQITLFRSGPRTTTQPTLYNLYIANIGTAPAQGPQTVTITYNSSEAPQQVFSSGWICTPTSGRMTCTRSGSLLADTNYAISLTFGPATAGLVWSFAATINTDGELNSANNTVADTSVAVNGGQKFVPLSTPCRIVDTRDAGSGGTVVKLTPRAFALAGKCGLPVSESADAATAYALNVTVVPRGSLGYLTIWPGGQDRPQVSTLNSLDGRVKANAALVQAGASGKVEAFVTDDSEVILDLTGYFTNANGLDFWPMTPCRVADTRNAVGPLGGPALGALASRTFAVGMAPCGVPDGARVFSLNATAVPAGPLGFLTLSNPDLARPVVSTLNAVTGTVVANAAILRGSVSNGSLSVYATENTHAILDMNGYFFNTSTAGLKYYPVNPCRIADTRNATGPFGGPALAAGVERVFEVPAVGACGIPSTARAYALNATVVPGGLFGFLTMWPTGTARPTVSTLNAVDGAITSNAAIVPAGAVNGRISVFGSESTHLILDINGYFAP